MEVEKDIALTETQQKPGYKKTKLGWIPEEWQFVEFDKVAGKSAKKYDPASKESLPCVELEHIEQETGSINGYVNSVDQKSIKSRFFRGEVLFGKLRPYLRKYWIAEFDGVCSSEIWVLIPRKELMEGVFLHALIQQHRFIQAANVTSGSKMPRADWDFVSKFPILVPPLPEQRAIAAVLSTWDRAIDSTRQLIEKQKARQKGLMQQLLSGKKRLDGFEGEWVAHYVGEVFDFLRNTSFSRDNLGEGKYYYLHYGDIHVKFRQTILSVTDNPSIPKLKSEFETSKSFDLLQNGDLIIADASEDTEGIGDCIEIQNVQHSKIIAGLHTIALRDVKWLTADYFRGYYFKSDIIRNQLRRLATGVSVYGISKKSVKTVLMKLPSIEEQRAIAAVLSIGEAEIKQSEQFLAALQQQKKGLMQKLLTGEVRVKTNTL